MYLLAVDTIFCVVTILVYILFVALIWLISTYSSSPCPSCGNRKGYEIMTRRIPGTERPVPGSEREGAFFLAMYWVRHKCQLCGHEWSTEEIKQL